MSTPFISKKYRYLLIGVALLLLAALIAVFSYAKWHDVNYFGKVLSVQENSVIISDLKVGERTILITDKTIICPSNPYTRSS